MFVPLLRCNHTVIYTWIPHITVLLHWLPVYIDDCFRLDGANSRFSHYWSLYLQRHSVRFNGTNWVSKCRCNQSGLTPNYYTSKVIISSHVSEEGQIFSRQSKTPYPCQVNTHIFQTAHFQFVIETIDLNLLDKTPERVTGDDLTSMTSYCMNSGLVEHCVNTSLICSLDAVTTKETHVSLAPLPSAVALLVQYVCSMSLLLVTTEQICCWISHPLLCQFVCFQAEQLKHFPTYPAAIRSFVSVRTAAGNDGLIFHAPPPARVDVIYIISSPLEALWRACVSFRGSRVFASALQG